MHRSTLTLLVLIPLTVWVMETPPAPVRAAAQASSSHGPFRVRSYMGKCLTYGQFVIDPDPESDPPPPQSGEPVFIDDCGGGSTLPGGFDRTFQQIVVEEINDSHEVVLRAGERYIGVAGDLVKGAALELQAYTGRPGQIFALDGDSIILVEEVTDDPDGVIVHTRRELVVEVKNARGASGTPLVLGKRDLNDPEFWDFNSVDGTYRPPTNGFVRVPEEMDFFAALARATWGSVIQVAPDQVIDLSFLDASSFLQIPPGVTIRGNRRGIQRGPRFTSTNDGDVINQFVSSGDFVRITGVELEGPTRSRLPFAPASGTGIQVENRPVDAQRRLGATLVDHNKLSDYPVAAISVFSGSVLADWACGGQPGPLPGAPVQIVRNFIHHNVRKGLGYGVSVGVDGFAEIVGNTFLMNRHAIAADGTALSGYRARHNLVLSNVPSYKTTRLEQADFDMHGSDGSSQHTGGIGGGRVEIEGNTFLGSNRLNYDLRGRPCEPNRFVNNVSQQSAFGALRWYQPQILFSDPPQSVIDACEAELTTEEERVVHQFYCGVQKTPPDDLPPWLEVAGNQFSAGNPTNRLGVGDFDGDGRDDLLLATGQGWYFAPAGLVEWRQINAQTDRMQSLRFGDFDRDGRTDVLTKHGDAIVVSWGGLSDWEQVNASSHPVEDYAIGDFDGDRRSDIFYANGSEWFVSYGAVSAFVPYATANHRIGDLRFGDFDGDKKTDVFGVVSGQWSIVPGGTNTWMPLRSSLDDDVSRLVVADFDGDGRADVVSSQRAAIGSLWIWRISRGGLTGWTNIHVDTIPIHAAVGVGRFDEVAGADALTWGHSNRLALDIVKSATGAAIRWSTQEMR